MFSTVSSHTRTCYADGNWSDEVIECCEFSDKDIYFKNIFYVNNIPPSLPPSILNIIVTHVCNYFYVWFLSGIIILHSYDDAVACSNVTVCSVDEECRVRNGSATCISTVKGLF